MKGYNLEIAELENHAVGHSGVHLHNNSGSPVPRLAPGQPRQMLGEAIKYVKSLPRDAAARADAFQALATQIENHSGGVWRAARGTGTDGSNIFLGRQGEGLVVASDGRIFRGAIARGIDITPNGLQPNFGSLTPLD
jgi:hypothetical protein